MPYFDDIKHLLASTASVARCAAVEVLCTYGKAVTDEEAIKTLGRKLIQDLSAEVRRACAAALGAILEGAGELIKDAEEEAEEERRQLEEERMRSKAASSATEASEVPESSGEPGSAAAVDEELDWLPKKKKKEKEKEEDQMSAAEICIRFITIQLKDDKYGIVRAACARALGSIGGKIIMAQAESLFACTLQDESRDARLAAAEALTKLGGLHSENLADVLGMSLEGGEDALSTTLAAEQALSQLGDLAAPHAGKLADALLYVDEEVRLIAITTLERFGEESMQYSRRLFRIALHDNADYVQQAALHALAVLGGKLEVSEYASALAEAMQSEAVSVRWGAMKAMQVLGPQSMLPHAPLFVDFLVDDSWYVRRMAVDLLVTLGPAVADSTKEGLIEILGDADADVRIAVNNVLSKQGVASSSGIEAVIQQVRTEERMDVLSALMATVGSFGEEAVLPFIEDLDLGLYSKKEEFRYATTLAIAVLGGDLVRLRKDQLQTMAGQDKSRRVCDAADEALKHLGL